MNQRSPDKDWEQWLDFDPFADMPLENRLGFFTTSALDLSPDFESALTMLKQLADPQKPAFEDELEYRWLITASSLDPEQQRLLWVEWRTKDQGHLGFDNYYLKARDREGALRLWEIETYNPYFGCQVHYLGWAENSAILIYEDKHACFVACLDPENQVRRLEIGPEWQLTETPAQHLRFCDPVTAEWTTVPLPLPAAG